MNKIDTNFKKRIVVISTYKYLVYLSIKVLCGVLTGMPFTGQCNDLHKVAHPILLMHLNRPVALRGHMTMLPLNDVLESSWYQKLTEHIKLSYFRNLRENAFKEDILWHFDFSKKQYDLYWPPCCRAYSCPPTWRPKLLFAYILLNVW